MSDLGKKYDWLHELDFDGNRILDHEHDCLDELPHGWYKAYAEMMCEELDAAIKNAKLEKEFVVLQVKEKYGRMEFYHAPTTEKIGNIIDKYSFLSENICMFCGKPDVHMVLKTGWIFPACKDCYEKTNYKLPYEDVIRNHKDEIVDNKMATTMNFRRFSKEGSYDYSIDISATANAIRKEYETKRKPIRVINRKSFLENVLDAAKKEGYNEGQIYTMEKGIGVVKEARLDKNDNALFLLGMNVYTVTYDIVSKVLKDSFIVIEGTDNFNPKEMILEMDADNKLIGKL